MMIVDVDDAAAAIDILVHRSSLRSADGPRGVKSAAPRHIEYGRAQIENDPSPNKLQEMELRIR